MLLKQDSMHITKKKLHFSSLYFPPKQDCGNLPELHFQCRKNKTTRKRSIKENPTIQITALYRLEGREEKNSTQKLSSYQIANHLPLDIYDYFLLSLGKVRPLLSFVLQNKYNWFVAYKQQRAEKNLTTMSLSWCRHDAFNKSLSQVGNLQFKETKRQVSGESN